FFHCIGYPRISSDMSACPRVKAEEVSGPEANKKYYRVFLEYGDVIFSMSEINFNLAETHGCRIPVFAEGPGGVIRGLYVSFPYKMVNGKMVRANNNGNPRFLICEHYTLTLIAGDYGSGRVVATHSLWPGEDTKLYVRS